MNRRFTYYHDPKELESKELKPRVRSIPNRVRRFLFELNNLTKADSGERNSRCTQVSSQSFTSSESETLSPRVVETELYSGTKPKRKKIKPRVSSLAREFSSRNCVMRCALCDYPYDSTKRRKPPHPYSPTCVPLQKTRVDGTMGLSRVAPGYHNLPGQKKAKVTRLKRRRSSTELYKGLVAVSTE